MALVVPLSSRRMGDEPEIVWPVSARMRVSRPEALSVVGTACCACSPGQVA